MNLPALYKKTSTGAIQGWQVSVEPIPWNGHHDHMDSDPATIITVYGQVGGKSQTAKEIVKQGKNTGKVNETTPRQQAFLEAKSQWEKKKKKGYVENIDDAQADKIDTNSIIGGIEPMLAHTYEKQGHKIQYPAFVQPKLDGHRCIAIIQDGDVSLWSRTRKPITGVPHIAEYLAATFPTGTIVLDGELYNHDYKDNFEELTGFIRSETPKPGHEVVQYWIYDVVNDLPFKDRFDLLWGIKSEISSAGLSGSLVVVETDEAASEEEMIQIFGVYMNYGFEGLMVRNANGLYQHKRSYGLQKVKLMQDAEFEILNVISGKGKMEGKAIFVCQVPNTNNAFTVKMKGSLDSLTEYLDNKDNYIGRELTVQFQKFSAEGTPIFPVGLRIREDV